MIIKFLANGTGDPKLAASYLLAEQDHLGNQRAGVEILRGDPMVFTAIASSLKFQYCYTSAVIAWSPEDVVSDEQLNEVLDLFEEHAFAGLGPEQYHMTAVMHGDDDGSRHLHILIPRVELTTGKSLNVAPPGHQYYFDTLRDFLNHKYGWVRPDDPARMKTTQPKNHHVLQNAAAVKAGLLGQSKKTRVEMIDAYIEQRIIYGVINNRDELVQSLKEIDEIGQVANKSISIKFNETRDRLTGAFYHAGFSFSAYREAPARQAGVRSALPGHHDKHKECSGGLAQLIDRLETARSKRAEYNQSYYRAKASRNEETVGQASEISYALGATVHQDFSRETDSRHRVNAVSDQNGDAVSRLDELSPESAASIDTIPERDDGNTPSNTAEQRSASTVQQRAQEQHAANDGIAKTDEPSVPEPGFESGQAQDSDQGSTSRDNSANGEDTATIAQNYMESWDIRRIRYPLVRQEIHLNTGVKNERNTATDSKKPVDHDTTETDSSLRAKVADRAREKCQSATDHRSAGSIYQRAQELAQASSQQERDIKERNISLEQRAERQRVEAKSTREYLKTLSGRNTERSFIETYNGFIRRIRNEIQGSLGRITQYLKTPSIDTTSGTEVFTTLYERIRNFGFDRLVNIARRRIKRQEFIERIKETQQQIALIQQETIAKFAMNTITHELRHIQSIYPHLHLSESIRSASGAEGYFHDFNNMEMPPDKKDLDLAAYVFYIGKCLDELKGQLNTLGHEELEQFKRFIIVVEQHLDQIQLNQIIEPLQQIYQNTRLEIGVLVRDFKVELASCDYVFTRVQNQQGPEFLYLSQTDINGPY